MGKSSYTQSHSQLLSSSSNSTRLGSIRTIFQLLTILLTTLIISILYISQDNKEPSPSLEDHARERDTLEQIQTFPKCDYLLGKWVYDNETLYPLYKENECSFMSDQLACEKFGRKDLSYQKWRWQPQNCDLLRFNATALLEKIRNKRVVYVGDSLNRGQWISMICLVDSSIPSKLKSMHTFDSLSVFTALVSSVFRIYLSLSLSLTFCKITPDELTSYLHPTL